MSTNNIFFNFKDITSVPLVGTNVVLKPLIYPIANGIQTAINDPITQVTDATGSVYYNNIVLPNLFKVDILGPRQSVITYYVNCPTASNDNLPFNASTYIISASIDNGNPTDIYFSLENIVSNPYAVNRVRVTPVAPYIPQVNSGSIVPGNPKDFTTNASGAFTASQMVPGIYSVQGFSQTVKNIPRFFISIPANSGSLTLNQVIIPTNEEQINISIPFANAPGQGMTIAQLFATFQTIITSGSFFDINVANAISSSFATLAQDCLGTSSFAQTASIALQAPFQSSSLFASESLTSSFSDTASYAFSASHALNSDNSLNAVSASHAFFSDTASNALTANTASTALTALTASYLTSAPSSSVSASYAQTASVAFLSNQSTSASYAQTASVVLTATTSSTALTASLAQLAVVALDVSHSGAITNEFPKWINGKLSDSSSFYDDGTTVTVSASINAPQIKIFPTGTQPFTVTNEAPWFNPVVQVQIPDGVNPLFLISGNVSSSFISLNPTASCVFNNSGSVVVSNTLTASIVQANQLIGPLTGTASFAVTASNSTTASFAITASHVDTSSFAITASALPAKTELVDPILVWDADNLGQGNVVGLTEYPSKGLLFFWQSGSGDPPIVIMRTVGSQSLWQGIQSFVTASGYWSGTASYALHGLSSSFATTAQSMSVLDPLGNFWYTDGISWYNTASFSLPILRLLGGASPSLNLNGELNVFETANSSTPMIVLRDDAANPFTYNLFEVYISGSNPPAVYIDREGLIHGTASLALRAFDADTASFFGGSVSSASFATSASYAQTAPLYVLKSGDNMSGQLYMQTGAGLVLVNSSMGIIFQGGSPQDFLLKSANTDLLQLASRSGSVYFTGSTVIADNFQGTASVALTSLSTVSASYAKTIDPIQRGPINITDLTNVAVLNIYGGAAGSQTSSISSSPAGLVLSTNGTIFMSNDVNIGGHNIISGGGQFLGTASRAVSASVADVSTSASYAATASVLLGSIVSSSYALTASNAVTASNSITSSKSISASYAQTAPLYLPLAGGNVSGLVDFQTGGGIRMENSSNGIQFAGGTSDDFTLQIQTNDLLALTSRSGSIRFTASTVIADRFQGTASWAQTCSIANAISFIPPTASYTPLARTASNATTASYALSAATASFVTASNVLGRVSLAQAAVTADFATFANQAATASYFTHPTASMPFLVTDGASSCSIDQNGITMGDTGILSTFSATNGFGNTIQIKAAASFCQIESSTDALRLHNSASGMTVYLTSSHVGLNVVNPTNTLDVSGNISCSVITASLFAGTASNAITASFALNGGLQVSGSWASESLHSINSDTASYISESISFPTAVAGYFPFWTYGTNITLATQSVLFTDGTHLTASGNISGSITNAVTASYALTCSFALNGGSGGGSTVSASWASQSLSSSNATTASFAITASYLIGWELLRTQSLTPITSANNFTSVVGLFPTSSYMGAFVNFGIITGSNQRVGQIYTTWLNDGATITYTEADSPSIGDTSTLTLATDLSASYFRLLATVIPSNVAPYTIKSFVSYI